MMKRSTPMTPKPMNQALTKRTGYPSSTSNPRPIDDLVDRAFEFDRAALNQPASAGSHRAPC
jgi:hypothetical protein